MNRSNGKVLSAIVQPIGRIVTVSLVVTSFYFCTASPRSVAVPGTTISSYLGSRFESTGRRCTGNSLREIGTQQEDPDNWNSGWQFLRNQSSATGEIANRIFYMDGVKKSQKYWQCNKGIWGQRRVPLEYVHRYKTENWFCDSPGIPCAYVGSVTTRWNEGTQLSQ